MIELPLENIQNYRAQTFRILPDLYLKSEQDAVKFVNERGFIFFWPIKGTELPSLWAATVGNRPVPNNHDDPGHVTWNWKDSLLDQRVWYYARILRKRNTILSLDILPYFYALSPNYGDYENDYMEQYELGKMTYETRRVYEALLDSGPLDSLELRRRANLASSENNSRFNQALDALQMDFKILPMGISDSGAWHYSFIYDITPRYYPDLENRTRFISDEEARIRLAEAYLKSVGAARKKDFAHLFKWRPGEIEKTIQKLLENNLASLCGTKDEWVILNSLI